MNCVVLHAARQLPAWLISDVGQNMNSKQRLLFTLFALAACDVVRAVEFCGFISIARTTYFVLADAKTGDRSQLLAVGQSFQGYTIIDFESQAEVLILRHGANHVRRALKSPTISEGKGESAPTAISISIAGYASLSVGEDPVALESLREEFLRAAALAPQPAIDIRPSKYSRAAYVSAVIKLCKECGLKKVSISTGE